jgi:hypothetical protein
MSDVTLSGALEIFAQHGVQMSRQMLHRSILQPHWAAKDYARRSGSTWLIDRVEAQHWAHYVAEVQRRKAAGLLPQNHQYDECECQRYTDGALWDD